MIGSELNDPHTAEMPRKSFNTGVGMQTTLKGTLKDSWRVWVKSMMSRDGLSFAYESAIRSVLDRGYTFCEDCFMVKANKDIHLAVALMSPLYKVYTIEVDVHRCECQLKPVSKK